MNLFFDYYLGPQLLCVTALDHVPFKVIEIPAYNPGGLKHTMNLIQSKNIFMILLSIALCTSGRASFTT